MTLYYFVLVAGQAEPIPVKANKFFIDSNGRLIFTCEHGDMIAAFNANAWYGVTSEYIPDDELDEDVPFMPEAPVNGH